MRANYEQNASPRSDEEVANASAWVKIAGPSSSVQHPHMHNGPIGSFLQVPEMSSANASQDWSSLPYPFPYDEGWWNSAQEGLIALDTTQTDSSPNTGDDSQAHGAGNEQVASNPSTTTATKQKKRRRTALDKHDAAPAADEYRMQALTGEALSRAKTELSTCSWRNIDLSGVASLPCEDQHAFSMCHMGPDPLDYYGAPLRRGSFSARIIEPFTNNFRRPYLQLPGTDSLVVRPPTKSLHLVFTFFPLLASPFSLESGFALMTICRRKAGEARWDPVGFVSYEDGKSKKKLVGSQIGFVGNLERCTKDAGKRVWGERTSHIANNNVNAKPVRIEPRGSAKNYKPEDQFCLLVSLHTPKGRLMSDTMGEMCVARTNPFHFQEKQVESSLQHLLQELDKLSVSQRTSLVNSAQDKEMALLLMINASSTQEAAGLLSQQRISDLPATACPFSTFFTGKQEAQGSPEVIIRLRHIARLMGQLHSNPELTSKYPTYLKSMNLAAADGRFAQLADTGMETHDAWLQSQGVHLKPYDVMDRAQILQSIMAERRYRSKWVVCVGNVYPDAIMVDQHDPTLVYSLAEDGRESPLELCDRLYPLARLAFTSKIAREDIESTLLIPYKIGCNSMGQCTSGGGGEGTGEKERAISLERFWLHLHAIHIDYFFYWTKFRNGGACRRIQERLLQEDQHFHESFFGPDRFKKFSIHNNNKKTTETIAVF